jgi:NAD(P) transhydrogenase
VPHIYAAGDVIGFPALASTSMEQGRLAVCHALHQGGGRRVTEFPIGIYTVPEISLIGETEQALASAGVDYVVGRAQLRETARGQIRGVQTGMLKLLVARADHKLRGVHILGEGATELIHLGQAVLQLGGTVDYFVDSVFNYPTYAEAYKTAALDAWNRLNGAGV